MRFRAPTRYVHPAWAVALADVDLTAGVLDVVDIDRKTNKTAEAHASRTIRGIEPAVYHAPDTTVPTITNDPEET